MAIILLKSNLSPSSNFAPHQSILHEQLVILSESKSVKIAPNLKKAFKVKFWLNMISKALQYLGLVPSTSPDCLPCPLSPLYDPATLDFFQDLRYLVSLFCLHGMLFCPYSLSFLGLLPLQSSYSLRLISLPTIDF